MILVIERVGLAQLRDMDLNLLRVFDSVFRTGRVVDAAELLEVSQPAVSNALKKLRSMYQRKQQSGCFFYYITFSCPTQPSIFL